MPKRLSVSRVISRYGVDTAPRTSIVVSRSATGSAISRPVINCDDIEPSTVTRPPRIGPHTSIGSLPPPSRTSTPSSISGSTIIDMGRCLSVPSPVMQMGLSPSEAIGVKRRAASPDSPTLSTLLRGARPPSMISVF